MRSACATVVLLLAAMAQALAAQQSPPAQNPPPPAAVSPPQATPPAPPPPQHVLTTVILDPAHGGTDEGARGPNGAVEKDIALAYARAARSELERQGFRVILTRDGDQDPSFDDRAAIVNARRNAIFISLHVSSTGLPGTARAYSYEFPQAPDTVPLPAPTPISNSSQQAPAPPPAPPPIPMPVGVIPWETAQKPFTSLSLRLAEILQSELAQKFSGSPQSSTPVAERSLRSVAAPAVAVEISSVTAGDEKSLESFAPSLATAIARAVVAFRPVYEGAAR